MKRLVCFVLCIVLVLPMTACGKQYRGIYKMSPDAASLMEDAIELLDMCINKEISAEECAEQLETISEKNKGSGDQYVSLTAIGISIVALDIKTTLFGVSIGEDTMIGVKNTVKEWREYFYNDLYGE